MLNQKKNQSCFPQIKSNLVSISCYQEEHKRITCKLLQLTRVL